MTLITNSDTAYPSQDMLEIREHSELNINYKLSLFFKGTTEDY